MNDNEIREKNINSDIMSAFNAIKKKVRNILKYNQSKSRVLIKILI